LSERYGLKYFSGGDALKALAIDVGYKPRDRGWWETEEGMNFLNVRGRDPGFDRRVDEKMMNEAKKGDVVLDSWTMPWLLKDGFKVWLDASPEVRARRIAKRDGISYKKASKALKERDAKTKAIYKRLYGFDLGEDFSPFDLILDVNELTSKEVFQTTCVVVERLVMGKS
jgi:cytidylate kinase